MAGTKNILKQLTFVVLICCWAPSNAQDLHLSQYDADPLYLSPALAGAFNGKHRVHAHYRTQWAAIAARPFLTTNLSYDTPYKKFGLGVEIMNTRSGAGNYNAFNALVSASYDIALDSAKKNHIAIGLQGGMIQKSLNFNKLYFGNQYSNLNGGSFDQSLSNGETFANSNFIIPDLSVGFSYYYASETSRINPFLIASAFHLTKPVETFYSTLNRLPMRYLVNAGFKLNVSESFMITPKFLYMKQANATEMTEGLMMQFYLKESDVFLLVGGTYRNNDAAIIETGIKKGSYTCRLSYDVNVSSLSPATNGRGGFEISITYITKKPQPEVKRNCPRL